MNGQDCDFVVVSGSGIDGVSFPDLYYTTIYGPRCVQHKRGERIQVELIEPKMFAASLKDGSLGRAIRGHVVEVRSIAKIDKVVNKVDNQSSLVDKQPHYETKQTNSAEATASFMNAVKVDAPVLHTIEGGTVYGNPASAAPAYVEVKYGATEANIPKVNTPSIAKPVVDEKLKDFDALPFMDQLKFVKQCEDQLILELISKTYESKQLKNNVARRLKILKDKK